MEQDNIQIVKKRRLKKTGILLIILLILILGYGIYYVYDIKITNIYITGSTILNDQEIIEISGLENYPNSLKNSTKKITEKLNKNPYIISSKVTKKNLFREVYIEIEENKPLFYYQNKVILKDGEKVDDKFDIPVVVNEINEEVYDEFIDCMDHVDDDILIKISEIKYDPNDIDKKRFYLTMNDGNYVYVTLNKIEKINNYINIVKTFNEKKGILYLDSGEFFEIFEN